MKDHKTKILAALLAGILMLWMFIGIQQNELGLRQLYYFLDIPAFLLIVGITIAITMYKAPPGVLNLCYLLLIEEPTGIPRPQVEMTRQFIKRFGNVALIIGMVGTAVGCWLMLHFFEEPEYIGLGVVIGVISFFYGIILKILAFLSVQKINRILEQQ